MNNFQRAYAISNAHVGRDFEEKAYQFFASRGIKLQKDLLVPVGVASLRKMRTFDLGNESEKILVECKLHKWTFGENVPSAKITVWNESMYYFHLAPEGYRKIFFVLRDHSPKRNITLAEHYIKNYGHLIPGDVEIVEYKYGKHIGKRHLGTRASDTST